MADNTIALGIRPPALPDYNALTMQRANMMQGFAEQDAQRAQSQNLMAQTQATMAQQAITNQRNAALDRQAAQKAEAESAKAADDRIAARMELSRQLLNDIDPDSPNAAQQYTAWHQGNHGDPVLGPYLRNMGVTAEQSRATIDAAAARGPSALRTLILQSRMGLDKFVEANKPTLTNQDYGGGMRVLGTPGLGGAAKVVPGSEIPKTLSPADARPELRNVAPGETIVEIPRGAPPAPDGGAQISSRAIVDQVDSFLPGLTVNSTARTPAHNAAVDGVPNSYHTSDQAVDYAIPQGMTAESLAVRLRQGLGPQFQVIPEPAKNHVHVEPAPGIARAAVGSRVVAQGPAKPDMTPAQRQAQIRSDRTYASGLKSDFMAEPTVKDYATIDTAYSTTRALGTKRNPTPQDDTALTFAFMKMLDPGSVVRESEFALVAKGAGLSDRAAMALNQAIRGKGLTPQIRADIVAAAGTVFAERRKAYDETTNTYRQQAEEAGVDPNQVVRQGGRSNPTAAAPGRAGGTEIRVGGETVIVRPKP
jgi:hypothetical protein